MKRVGALLVCWMMVLLPGAASFAQTVLTDVWKDKAYRSSVEKILVFCIVQDQSRRTFFEDAIVRQLKDRWNDAVPSYIVIPPGKKVDKETALTRIRNLGASAILTLRLVDKVTVQTQLPDPAKKESGATSRWSEYYQSLSDPQKRKKDDPAYLETILFDTASEQRVWAARSVTKVVEVNQELITTFITRIVDQLASDKMIR